MLYVVSSLVDVVEEEGRLMRCAWIADLLFVRYGRIDLTILTTSSPPRTSPSSSPLDQTSNRKTNSSKNRRTAPHPLQSSPQSSQSSPNSLPSQLSLYALHSTIFPSFRYV